MYDKNSYVPDEKPTVMVSGGFDPVHAGHIRMIRDAANFGRTLGPTPGSAIDAYILWQQNRKQEYGGLQTLC